MIPCISVSNMRESDRKTIETLVPSRTLMYRAATGVFRAADWRGETVIAVGGGNNGGDGFALACILRGRGYACHVVKLSDHLSADSAYFAQKADELGVPIAAYAPGAFSRCDIVVDCLLGTGLCSARAVQHCDQRDQCVRGPCDQRGHSQRHERRHRRSDDRCAQRFDGHHRLCENRPHQGRCRKLYVPARLCRHWHRVGP